MSAFDNGVGGIGSATSSSLGSVVTTGVGSGSPTVPWGSSGAPVISPFFTAATIDPVRWNQLFPYRLVVVDVTKGNAVVTGGGSSSGGGTSSGLSGIPNPLASLSSPKGTVQYTLQGTPTLTFSPLSTSNWQFNLPITPQQLSITDQYAINTSATLRGIVEEHNGIKFKLISASGSLGVWPYRESVISPPGGSGILSQVFGGTIQAATGLINQIGSVINTFNSGSPVTPPKTISPTDPKSTFGGTSTGYYQAMYLQQFLEQYAEAKKNPANAAWRLVFDIQKQNQSYVVTPMQFTWQQSASKPMEIMYQLQFKAWRRINLKQTLQKPTPAQSYALTPNLLQNILNTITQARLVCSSAIALIGAVTADVSKVFSVISQTALFVKDLLGVGTAASDLPSSIAQDFSSAIQQFAFLNSSQISNSVTTPKGSAAIKALVQNSINNNGLSPRAVANRQLGPAAASSQQVSNSSAILSNPNANVDLLDQIPTNQLNLNTAQQNKLNQILSNTALTVQQLKNNQAVIQGLSVQLADYFGAGNATYNQLFGLTPPPTKIQPMTIDQFLLLDTLYEFIQSISYLTATTQVTDLNIINSLDYVAGLANQSGIPFNIPNSKIYVPVPFNSTMESIATRYLGDATRWIEIATLNNLEEPYIDESGFQLPLLSNAIGRQIVVSNDQNLYFGQTIILKSSTQTQVARQITNITPLPNGNSYLITLNGDPNLNNFVTADKAFIQAYLPNTTNSQQKIFIPTDLPPPTYPGQLNIVPPGIAVSDPLTGLSGVDLLLTDSGDLALNNYADFMISYGLTNLIQALRILFTTVINSFILHPEYGLGIRPGTSISDLNIQQLYEQINSQVTQDPRFSSVTSLQIQASPPTLSISLGVSLPGMQGTLPVNFQLGA